MAETPLVQLIRVERTERWSWLAPVLALLAFIGLGYVVFLAFARGFFEGATVTLLGVAVAAGVAAFFSPCAFPFLPTVLSVQALRSNPERVPMKAATSDGAVAGLGVVAFNVVLGAAVGLAGAGFAQSLVLLAPNPSPITLGIRYAVAGVLVLVGLLQILNRGGHGALAARIANAFSRLARAGRGYHGLFLYGFAYTAIGIGCTGPFLASVVLVGFAAGGIGPALLAFLTFALTMAGLMVVVSLLAASQPQRIRALAEHAASVKRFAGVALVTFGILLGVFTAAPTLLRGLFP